MNPYALVGHRARKSHICVECKTTITPGSRYLELVGGPGYDPYRGGPKYHGECAAALLKPSAEPAGSYRVVVDHPWEILLSGVSHAEAQSFIDDNQEDSRYRDLDLQIEQEARA